MFPEPSHRTAFSGLLLGLLTLATLLGAGLIGQPEQARSTGGQPDGLVDEWPSSTTKCRLVATPLREERDAGRIEARSQLQNAGQDPASPRALQATWIGSQLLTELRFGKRQIPVGAAASPALISFDAAEIELAPDGEPVDLVLVFEGEPGARWQAGPSLLLMRDGCDLALGVDETAGCALEVAEPVIDPVVKHRLGYALTNTNAAPISLAALELDWPVAINGALVGMSMRLGGAGEPPIALELPFKRPPALLSLLRSLGQPVIVPEGARLELNADFERPAAAEGYSLALLGSDGCLTQKTSWLSTPSCNTEFKAFKMDQRSSSLLLANSQGITQTLSSLDVIWQPEHQGPLVDVLVDGMKISAGALEQSPASIALPRALPIGPGQSVELKLIFDPARAEPDPVSPGAPLIDGAARSSASPFDQIGGGDLSVIARFRGGCQAVATTLGGEQDLACRVTGGDLLRDERSPESDASVRLSNSGADVRLQEIRASWPVHNGSLTGVFLGDTALIDAAVPHAAEPAELKLLGEPLLARGSSAALRLTFERPAARGGYRLGLGFDNLSGADCAELVLSSPPVTPDCDLALAEPQVLPDAKTVEMVLVNRGEDPLELESLRLAWPTNGGMSTMRLRSLALIYDGEGEVQLLSQANQATPVFVRVAEADGRPVTLDAGERATLQMIFDEIRSPASLIRELKASLSFVEGCQVAYPPGGNVIGPERIRLEARIEHLPENGTSIYGPWEVREIGRELPWLISVDRGTEFVPSNIRPRAGDLVVIEAQLLETVNLAERITFLVSRPDRKFLGRVDRLGPVQSSGLPESIEVDGRPIGLVEGFTVVDQPEALTVGATVLVQGATGLDGVFVATRIEIVYAAAADTEHPVAFKGIVQASLEADAESRSPFENTRYILIIDAYEVHVSDALAERVGRPVAGQPVEVEGMAIDHQVRAEVLRNLPTPAPPRRIEGTLVGMPTGGLLGTWLVDTGGAGPTRTVSFTVGSVAVVDERRAPASLGMAVEATLRRGADGLDRAIRVRTDWP